MYELIFMILGHGGSLKGKSGQILEYQASQLPISGYGFTVNFSLLHIFKE